MGVYTRPYLILKDPEGNIVGSYEFEHQALKAAKLQFAGTYTLERPSGSFIGGSGLPVVVPVAPAPPSTLVATAFSSTVITLAWADNSDDETGFVIERSLDGSTGWTVLYTTGALATTYSDVNLTPETIYYYRVNAINAAGGSTYTLVDSATTLATAVDTPPSTDIPALTRTEIESEFEIMAQDAGGWTIWTPNTTTSVYYIDAVNGDDATATPYAYNAFADMKNPTMAGLVTYKTYYGAMLDGGDGDNWYLMRGGQEHSNLTRVHMPSGTSRTQRVVWAGYDITASGMPIISEWRWGQTRIWGVSANISIIGIDFRNNRLDPDHADFIGWGNSVDDDTGGIRVYSPTDGVNHWLVEGCIFRQVKLNSGSPTTREVMIRRNTFLTNFSELEHRQGFYHGTGSVLVEDNIFDHSGWYQQEGIGGPNEGQATVFNHCTYIPVVTICLMRNNIFSRPSSIGTKFTADGKDGVNTVKESLVLLENNLYYDCEFAISLGGNTTYQNGHRFRDIYILNNAIVNGGDSQPTGRSLGWSIQAHDWDTGVVSGNVITGSDNDAVNNVFAWYVTGTITDVSVNNNVVYNLGNVADTTGKMIFFDEDYLSSMTNVSHDNNWIQQPNAGSEMLEDNTASGVTHTGNTFFASNSDESTWFRGVTSNYADFAAWNATTDGSNVYSQVTFTDATRTVQTYMGSIGGTATKQGFIDAIRGQSIYNWNDQLTGHVISDYIRAGFTPV